MLYIFTPLLAPAGNMNSLKKLKAHTRTSTFPFLRYPHVQEAAWRSDAEKYMEKKIYPMLHAARVRRAWV